MDEIRIAKPYYEKCIDGGRVVADIITPGGEQHKLWYKAEEKYASKLVYERADAFLVGLIPYIAYYGGKVVSEAPISAHLLHNLRHLLSPILPDFHPDFYPLDIKAPDDISQLSVDGSLNVGTGCSCGIDSMSTLATYLEDVSNGQNFMQKSVPPTLRVNILAFFDVGSHENLNQLAKERERLAEDFATSLNLPLVKITSNVAFFNAGFSHVAIHTFRSMSAVLVMQKLFSAYHYASAYPISKFKISSEGVAYADEYILRCLSTETTRLYSALAPLTRQQRSALAADFEPAHNFLNVCVRSIHNCGLCFKCARTMFQLDLTGKLDKFKNVFDIEAYRKNKKKILKLLAKDTHFHDEFLSAVKMAPEYSPFSYTRLSVAFCLTKFSTSLINTRKSLKRRIKSFFKHNKP